MWRSVHIALLDEWGSTRAAGVVSLSPVPGNDRVGVSHHKSVDPAHRGQGLSRVLDDALVSAARARGVTTLVCTVRADNVAQHAAMRGLGWVRVGDAGPTAHLYVRAV